MLEKRFYGERVRRYMDKMARVLYDAYLRMDKERESQKMPNPTPEEVDIVSWPQTWPDARCGFEKPLKDVYASEQTDVVIDSRIGTVYIYHAGHFVRRLDRQSPAFASAMRDRNLPGAVDEEAWLELS